MALTSRRLYGAVNDKTPLSVVFKTSIEMTEKNRKETKLIVR
jgi:hypothetical protein